MQWFAKKKSRVYFDHAASTPTDESVVEAMLPYFIEYFGNPGSMHAEGQMAMNTVSDARSRIAGILTAHSDEIVFTSGGTEANNLAIRGTVQACGMKVPHIITTTIEHPSVLEPVRALEREGAQATYLSVDRVGRVKPKDLRDALREHTALVSIMYVNNEVGSIQPINELVKVVRRHRKETGGVWPYVHVDASQAPLFLGLSMEKLGIDLMTLDAQKVYGPKGVGLLYKRRAVTIQPTVFGGNQENGLRPGTENVPLIVGFAKALELAEDRRLRDNAELTALRDYFITLIKRALPKVVVNGGMEHRVPNNVNISIPGHESAFMVVWLDAHGIACGSRSACSSEEDEPSHVIRAMGGSSEEAQSSLRLTLGRGTTRKDIDRTVHELESMVQKLTNYK